MAGLVTWPVGGSYLELLGSSSGLMPRFLTPLNFCFRSIRARSSAFQVDEMLAGCGSSEISVFQFSVVYTGEHAIEDAAGLVIVDVFGIAPRLDF